MTLHPAQMLPFASLALGSAFALFMYPHSMTASLSAKSRNTIRRNAAILPAYSFVLGLLALLGWVAIAAGTKPIGLDGKPNAQLVIPQLFEDKFPSWSAGVAFAAIAIGGITAARVPDVMATGVHGVAVVAAVWEDPDPPRAAREIAELVHGT